MTLPLLTFAPLEGLTNVVYRRLHAKHFGGVDRYYIPFVSPTHEPAFTPRQLKDIAPQANEGLTAIAQLLTRRSEDFAWAARELSALGYDQVNLNLGCPAGTVVAKGKGAGFLREPVALSEFLFRIFDGNPPIPVTVKTRIGFSDVSEFEALADLYAHYPIAELIIHPRLKTDAYRGESRIDTFEKALPGLSMPVGYNGDIVTVDDAQAICRRFPNLSQIMMGRGPQADPALFRKLRGGTPATKAEILAFSEALFEGYAQHWDSRKNATMRMKEHWFYLFCLFDGIERDGKALYKERTPETFFATLNAMIANADIRTDAVAKWKKPL